MLPASLKEIGERAFYNCDSLNGSISFGNSLKSIGAFAFDRCFNIVGNLIFPPSLEFIGAYCFENCEGIDGAVILNEGLKHIGDGVFNHCKNVSNVELIIPSTLESIGGDTAYDVDEHSATPIDAPSQIVNHSSHVFYDFANQTLKRFSVNTGNEYFTTDNGVLFTSDMKRLIAYPPSREGEKYEIPEGVEIIDEMAFGRLSYGSAQQPLKEIVLPDSYTVRFSDNYYNALNRKAMSSLSSSIYYFSTVSSLSVKPTNEKYKSVDGCIYSFDESELICVPSGKRGNVRIPDSVSVIKNGAFSGCRMLDYILVPKNVSSISKVAFLDCPNVKLICYRGSYCEEYCSQNALAFHLFGDVNNDGEIRLEDYSLLESFISDNNSVFDALSLLTADYDIDYGIDAFDLYYIDKEINKQPY